MEKNILLSVFIFITFVYTVLGTATQYNVYYGQPLTASDVTKYTANNTLANCTIPVEPCDPKEGRRIDGTCNNLKFPSWGGSRTPYVRLLEPAYNLPSASKYEPRLSVSGEKLPEARDVRVKIWSEGRVEDDNLASLIAHMAVYMVTDVTNTRDTTNYVSWRPYCCKPEGANDYACVPNKVSPNDYVHRFSGITCLNLTRPLSYQTSGCLPDTTVPLRIVDATPLLDSSPVYGNTIEKARRTYKGGQLTTITVNGKTFPDTSTLNLLLGINFVGIILFWRNHNFIATQLAAVNPCWTDEQLFATARDINIATEAQMFLYELMPTLMGYDNLVADSIISSDEGFQDVYDSTVPPKITLEYPVVMRWLHSLQDGELKMYYTNGTFQSSFPIVELTANTKFLQDGDTMIYVTQGFFRQPTGKVGDFIAEPDIVQKGLGIIQKANDIMANDLAKNRYFYLQGYTRYVEYCFDRTITSFDDLCDLISPSNIELLKSIYTHVDDIDLMAGIWVENLKEGAKVPPTFYCLVADQMKRFQVSDRHFYASSTRPGAFTESQLAEIRKVSAARMLCDIGDGVTEVQLRAFEIPSDDNPIVPCSEIPALDFTQWKDSTCKKA